MRQLVFGLLLVGASGCFLFVEEADHGASADEALCATHEQCVERNERGWQCASGTCIDVRAEIPATPVLDDDACARSEDCACPGAEPCPYIADFATDTFFSPDAGEQVCGFDETTCEELQTCRSNLTCGAPRGEVRGGFACTADDECTAGLCVVLGEPTAERPEFPALDRSGIEPGVCLRTCDGDHQCPNVGDSGLRCLPFVFGRRVVRGCLPPTDPAETLCEVPSDCSDDRTCRFDSRRTTRRDRPTLAGVPVCDVPKGTRPTGAGCLPEAEPDAGSDCIGGLCTAACDYDSEIDRENFVFCDLGAPRSTDPSRCTQPCRNDADCPRPLTCSDGPDYAGVGGWVEAWDIQGDDFVPGRNVRGCTLRQGACTDEFDCRGPDEHPDGASGWDPVGAPRCVVHTEPGRLPASCEAADPAKASPGASCTSHGDCQSNLCVELAARPGVHHCSTPCFPAWKDRCADLATWLPGEFGELTGLRCEPIVYEGAEGLHACR